MRRSIKILGVVQGVGFRPFALRLASKLEVSGNVRNRDGSVLINIAGSKEALDEYVRRLTFDAPKGAVILKMTVTEHSDDENVENYTDEFVIEASDSDDSAGIMPVLSPDIATCKRCEEEMYDSHNRRYMHPFISCTDCGPRYSIINSIPYDRDTTVMDVFEMCTECRAEYVRTEDIRCHAQTIACNECGPKLMLEEFVGDAGDESCKLVGNEALVKAVKMLKEGHVLAVKDIGGYHFTCMADDVKALSKLRELKRRQNKAFAVMFADVDSVKEYAYVNELEEKCLLEKARPIVLVKKILGKDFPKDVCGDSADIGAFLPSNPIQIYLTKECGPLVMTSGNLGGEPIITSDEKMRRLVMAKGIVSAILSNDREIVTPLDDSIVRVFENRVQFVRRARGYVPLPVFIESDTDGKTILASGGDLKASFAYARNGQVVLSQYFGDLDDMDACGAWKSNIKRIGELHNLKADILACDMHPRYYSSQISGMMNEYEKVVKIQHHHAHIASVMAEHDIEGEVLGFAFDGTGYGTDGTIWGGEALLVNGAEFERLIHLETVPMCGGDEIARDADMALMCYLIQAGISPEEVFSFETKEEKDKLSLIESVLKFKVGSVESSSAGRLFDAVCALIGIRHYNSYEGECAMALERVASEADENNSDIKFNLPVTNGVWNTSELIRQMMAAVENGGNKSEIALAFHKALADAIVQFAIEYCTGYGRKIPIVLSGGVFMNKILTKSIIYSLEREGFVVYLNEKVPMNDGGLALGQAYVAGKAGDNSCV